MYWAVYFDVLVFGGFNQAGGIRIGV
jgi:hypothetical protein